MPSDLFTFSTPKIIEMDGFIARKGAEAAPSHVKLTEIVTRVERGEVKPSPALLGA